MKVVVLLCAALLAVQTPPGYPDWDRAEPVEAYARRANLPPTLTLDLGGGVTWEGVLIPAGSFVMGAPPSESRNEIEAMLEKPHTVRLTRPFYIGKYELTQAQYERIMDANPSVTKGSTLPVHNVSWQNAQEFCQKASAKTGRRVDLPTDAQWEYACRAGTRTVYCSGNTIEDLTRVGWWADNSGKQLHPVGELPANGFGLHDMHGNVREFVRDLFENTSLEDAVDPVGPATGDPNNHVVRGGAYTANAALAGNCRAAVRRPTEVLTITGFRIIVEVR